MNFFEDEIVSIKCMELQNTVDIEVSGSNLFVANGILTHNSGMSSSDLEMTDVAESIGITAVCDLMLAGMRNEETDAMGQIIFKQLKNRFRKMQYKPKFVLGCDFDKQTFYDVSQGTQNLVEQTAAVQIDSSKIQEKFQLSRKKRNRFEGVDTGE